MVSNKKSGKPKFCFLKKEPIRSVTFSLLGICFVIFSLVLLVLTSVFESNQISLLEYFTLYFPKQTLVFFAILLLLTGLYVLGCTIQKLIQPLGVTDSLETAQECLDDKSFKNGAKVVAFGGGTGLATLLRGLKNYTNNIVAVVTAADDGGSSGRIRREWGLVPPGDIRSCLLALADTEPLMKSLFDYRFKAGEGLEGHNFGNLFILAMSEVTGDFETAVREFSRVLNVRGRVMTSTLDSIGLKATYEDGSEVFGESAINKRGVKIEKVSLVPDTSSPNPAALLAIDNADFIILGPGSLYTSILPNLLVPGIAEAIKMSKAPVLYVVNVMSEPGETTGYTASDHLNAILEHLSIIDLVDYVLINNADFSDETKKRYKEDGAFPVAVDLEKLDLLSVKIVLKDLASSNDFARHDPEKLAKAIIRIMSEEVL